MDIGLAKSHCHESHNVMTYTVSHALTSWILISHAFSESQTRKNLEAVGLISKFNRYYQYIASSIQRKHLAVAFNYISSRKIRTSHNF